MDYSHHTTSTSHQNCQLDSGWFTIWMSFFSPSCIMKISHIISLANPLKISRNHRKIPNDIAINHVFFQIDWVFMHIFLKQIYDSGTQNINLPFDHGKIPMYTPTIPSLHYGIPQHCHHHQISPQHSINIPIKSPSH